MAATSANLTARKRSSTLSSLQVPQVPPPLPYGATRLFTIWLHDQSQSDDAIFYLESWPGVSKGDLLRVTCATDGHNDEAFIDKGFLFRVPDNTVSGSKLQSQQMPTLSLSREVAGKFGFVMRNKVTLTKVDPSSVAADHVEIFFRDLYMGRRDMWRLTMYLEQQCIYAEQKTKFFGCVGASIKNIYKDGHQVSSAIFTSKTKLIPRSMSAKSTIFIQVCRELWEFADDGERYYEKIVHSFLPALITKWRESSTKHVVAIVLFSRVQYDESELEYAAGPLQKNDEGIWYKDFYKVVVDLEIIRDWKPSLVSLKESFWTFQRDILFRHHYHRPQSEDLSTEIPLARLVGRLSYAHEGPILEAINLGLNPMDTHYIDRSLSLTGCSTIVLTPGTGHFRVSKALLRFTTSRLLDQGFGMDLVCLTKAPPHRSPLFSFKGPQPELGTKEGQQREFGSREMDPLWAPDDVNKSLELFYWEPFWATVSFWDVQSDLPFREDRFVPRIKIPEIQMLGLLEHDVSSAIAIPYMEASSTAALHRSKGRPKKTLCDRHDIDVFSRRGKTDPIEVPAFNRTVSGSSTTSVQTLSPFPSKPTPGALRRPRKATIDAPLISPSIIGESSTSLLNHNQESTPSDWVHRRDRSEARNGHSVTKDVSPSRDSLHSSTSTTSATSSRKQDSRSGVAASRFSNNWLFRALSVAPIQPQASHISARKDETPASQSVTTDTFPSSSHPIRAKHPSTSSKIRTSLLKPIAEPINIRSIPPGSPTTGARVLHNDSGLAPRGSSYVQKPPSYSPHDDFIAMRRANSYTLAPVNPSRPATMIPHSQGVLARRWQHVFPKPTFIHDVKWAAMCTPACLPLTVEYYPPQAELERLYQNYDYDIFLGGDMASSFLLRKNNRKQTEDWPLLIMQEMVALRLVQGFQLVVAGKDSLPETPAHTLSSVGVIDMPTVLPIGASDVLKSTKDPVYLSMTNQIHRLAYDPIEQVVRVNRFVRQSSHQSNAFQYECLVWPKLGDGYTEVKTSFNFPGLDVYGWNRMDMLIAGWEHDMHDSLRYWRTRFLVIPTETSPPTTYGPSGDILNDEECRLLGIDRLAELFGKARWLAPGIKSDTFPPPRLLPTWLDPAACVLDEALMASVDEIHAAGPLKKKPSSDRSVEDTPLAVLAKAMREEDGVHIGDHHWHGKVYHDSFKGHEFVSWLVREFRDVSTREQGVEWGVKLQSQGLFQHVREEHTLMDGHYFYQLQSEYASAPARISKWFRSATVSAPRTAADSPENQKSTPGSLAQAGGETAIARKIRKRHVLSQTMVIDVDPSKRSDQAETAILHYDLIQNPGTAFHFELNWIGTSARCIDDILQHWMRAIERCGLKLVEGYVDPIMDITAKNVFQSCFPIRLVLAPPIIPDLAKRLPEGSSTGCYFEYAILRRFGYILDIEAGDCYPDTVDIFYSYRRASFKHSQFVHRSGMAFVQCIGGREGFRWLTNRLLASSNNHYGGSSRTPHETADVIRTDLHAFCSDVASLERFYADAVEQLPPIVVESPSVVGS